MKRPRTQQEELARVSRALRTLSGSNRALLRAEEEASLLREICRVVVEEAGYYSALVTRAERDERKSITPLAMVGDETGPPDPQGFTWADDEHGRSATGIAIRTGEPCVISDISADSYPQTWRERARERGVGSVLSLPLRLDGEIFGALTIAAPETDAFEEQEMQVLMEAAEDLAFGLQALRTRQRRKQAEEEILRLNRALQTRAAVNHALTHASDEGSLLGEICRVAVDECGYRLAWVGYLEPDDSKTLRPMAHAGFDEGFLALPRTWGATERAGRIGALMQAGVPWVVRDAVNDPDYPFREEARQRGFGSMIELPLRIEGELAGSLRIVAAEADEFDDKEVDLLMATVADLGYGLGALRTHAKAAAAEETIKRMAYFDAITGLPNRARLRALLEEATATAMHDGRPLALLRIDMERFRDINETIGDHEVDMLLRDIATRLEQAVGKAGKVAKTGESEFAVLLTSGGAEQAIQLAQKILIVLSEPIELSGLLLDARSSIGISLIPGHGTEADALMRRASIALDHARRSGAGYALFTGGLDLECAQRVSLMGDLRRAIERNELQLYCQPQLEMSSGRVCGAEALVRWQHPRLGMVNPGQFIKLAESTGLITPLTYWVLDTALRQSYAWHQQGLEQALSVNLSVCDLREPKLLEHISGSFATWGAQPDWIEFELTESALMEDPAGALETLTRLKRLDVKLTIDDFGTGYSSLSYLQRLPVDTIKIDQSFVVDMATNKDSATIVRSTIELAHNLDLTVVAEGVEDQGTFDRLAALGCDMAQGYCISKPIPADQFREWEARPERH
jgi:diguanylate cyclase (GGDEF)-like protein